MKSVFSVRGPLVAVISLILVAGFLTTNLTSYYVSKNSLRLALIDNELPLTSNNIYSEIQRDLLRPVFVASLMAADTFVQDWLLSGEKDPEKLIRYLDEIRRNYDLFTSFLISDATRNYYHFSGVTQVVSETDPKDAWFFRVRDMREDHELNVDSNEEQENALTIFINHKVFDREGNYLAATGVGLEFGTVARIVDRYKQHFGRHVYFVDDEGAIMVRSEGAVVVEDSLLSAPGMAAIAKDILTTDQGFYEYDRDGETMLVSTRHIPELKWRVVVEQRESDALAGIRESLLTNTVVGLGVVGLTLLIVMYTVNRFHNRLESMATTDGLTGIGNRAVFDVTMDQALKRHQRDNKPFSILLLDIDHFKRVNDTLGHLEGDRVIREIAEIVDKDVRSSDVLCRWGGEELIVLAHDCPLKNAITLAEKIRLAIEQASLAKLPDGAPITASLGVTQVHEDDNADRLLGRADGALYQAKQDGRNTVRWH
ncbi:sensor domain-containing diguanylate cyclase [Magnetospira sp. QH-2]|uniref:sensor domain-containing diguanylate cyclase n=1 Tax=Magnetospira sp. (strain QH-2) TaxID=1288970 RepID=UPI0003E8113A|nr:sensor domain-containing diguanylate cyclase [Magnetospira sp. QH-2]CCQ74325.1 Conserved protein of unknown function [Magnetospira sp. QH-2]